MATHSVVGRRTKRRDSPPKLTGHELYTADLRLPGTLCTRIVGSTWAHARVTRVDASAALAMPGVVAVLTNDDLQMQRDENGRPVARLLAGDEALYVGHPIALVLAESDVAAQDAAELVEVDYEPLPVVNTLEYALSRDAPKVSEAGAGAFEEEASMHNADAASAVDAVQEDLPPNVSNTSHFDRGDVAAGFREAAGVVELTLGSHSVHQSYIETQVCLAAPEAREGVRVYTSTQAAFHVRGKVADTLGMPLDQVTVEPMPVGGGFGGKFGLLEPLVAAAAMTVDRPVLLHYTRTDDFLTGNPAPDCHIRVKLGAKQDGTITALDTDLVFDAGSAAGSPLGIAAMLIGGYYRFPNLRIRGYEVETNKVSFGAYRAPGAQQASFAIESAMDELARCLNLDPMEMRLLNCVEEGDLRPSGAPWPRIGLKQTLEAVQAHPLWQHRAESHKRGRGVGLAVGGWPGGLEPATAICRLDQDGKVTVVLGSVDLNGTNTTFAQIAAEGLGLGVDDVRVTTANTAAAPFAGGTGGSKITYTVGPAVMRAADDAMRQIKRIAAVQLEVAPEDLEVVEGTVRVKGVPSSNISLKEIARLGLSGGSKHEPVLGTGASSITESAPGFSVHAAEVEVDDLTGEVTVTNYVAAQDVGFAINPATVEGQIHGGVAQGLGWALYEGIEYDEDGQVLTASLMDYAVPRASMIPPIDTILVEVASDAGAYGSKGVGEPPAIPGPAVIANALRDAAGIRLTEIPMRPRDVLAALNAKES